MPNAAATRDLHIDLLELSGPFVALETNDHDPIVRNETITPVPGRIKLDHRHTHTYTPIYTRSLSRAAQTIAGEWSYDDGRRSAASKVSF